MKQGRLLIDSGLTKQNASLKIRNIQCKTIISKSKLYGIDYSINPYTGCQHNCVYCYARSMFERWEQNRKWGKFVDIKLNAPAILQKQLQRIQKGSILISSVTDPYQPIEKESRLTRQLLSLLSKKKFQISILTKSALVTRDIGIFQENPDWEIGLTLTTADDTIRALMEPHASSTEERFKALRILVNAGVKTYAFLGPLLPFISEDSTLELLDTLSDLNVPHVLVDRLNIKQGSLEQIVSKLVNKMPCSTSQFLAACKQNSNYYFNLKRLIEKESSLRGIKTYFCY
ncbi:MAG: radical SAM protein [Promethearchaeota archaeon]